MGALTAKIASVKRFSPADRAGLEKMDYVWTVNGKEVFQMSQPDITNAILNSQLKLTLQVERGTFIVPSFDEIWPQPGKERAGKARTRMGYDYILRPCSTTALAIFHSRTTSPLAEDLELRSTSTTTQLRSTLMTNRRHEGREGGP